MKKYVVLVENTEVFSGSFGECIRYADGLMNSGNEDKDIAVVGEDFLTVYYLKYDSSREAYCKPIKWLGDLNTLAQYPRSRLERLYNYLIENNLSIGVSCVDDNGERLVKSTGFRSTEDKSKIIVNNPEYINVDTVIDAVLLGLPKGICDSAHSILIKLNDVEDSSNKRIYLWSRKCEDIDEYDIIVGHKL